MQKIKNKQTGETLTGEMTDVDRALMAFKIKGTRTFIPLEKEDWEVIQPPLPTGIGAVVKDRAFTYVRLSADNKGWKMLNAGDNLLSDDTVMRGGFTVLSHGVQL